MINFIISNINVLLITGDCSLLGTELNGILQDVFKWIQIAVPCLVVVLCMVDMGQAVLAQDEKGMKLAQGKVIKRIAIGVVIFFIPLVINILLDFAGIVTGTCGIGN